MNHQLSRSTEHCVSFYIKPFITFDESCARGGNQSKSSEQVQKQCAHYHTHCLAFDFYAKLGRGSYRFSLADYHVFTILAILRGDISLPEQRYCH